MFSLEKKDEPEDEAKGETKDEPVAEPDKVIITKQYNKEFLRWIVCVLECLKGSVMSSVSLPEKFSFHRLLELEQGWLGLSLSFDSSIALIFTQSCNLNLLLYE